MRSFQNFILLFLICQHTVGQSQVIEFQVDAKAISNPKEFGIRGNLPPLSWDKTYYLKDAKSDGIYSGEISFETNEKVLEYKFVYEDKKTIFEDGSNRILFLDKSDMPVNAIWNTPSKIDINSLPKLTSNQLLEDFQLVKKALLEVHPGLYRHHSKHQIDSIFDHFEAFFSKPMSYQNAFLNFTKLTASIKCGHTFPSLHNQTGFIQQIILDQADKLPFTFRIIHNSLIILANASNNPMLNEFREVTAINNHSVKEILEQLIKLVKADGLNDAKRLADLNIFGIESYEMFDAYFPLIFRPDSGYFNLKTKIPLTQEEENISVKAISRSQRKEAIRSNYTKLPTSMDDLWQIQFWENETAYLKLGTFDVFQLSFDWDKFLKSAFKEIHKRKSQHLVLDIRWNEGGQDEVLLKLGQFLAQSPISMVERKDLVTYQKISEEIKPYLFTWNDEFYDLTDKVVKDTSRFYRFKDDVATEIHPFANNFRGDVFLLINSANSSSTFYFAEILKKNKLATLIGETTGGSQKGLNGGQIFFLRLPNSQIEIDIPIIGTFSPGKPDQGILPDYTVLEDIQSILSGEDKVINFTKDLISKK